MHKSQQYDFRPPAYCGCIHASTVQQLGRCKAPRSSTVRGPSRGLASVCHAAAQETLLYDFYDQLIPYEQAWSWQKQRVAELSSQQTQDRRDTVFLLQHPPVYTLGAGSTESHVKFDLDSPPYPLYRTERGGEVTYHGPGQLVMYPILDLTHHTQDLHWYLRSLEEVIIRALANTSGLHGKRIDGLTGVWVQGHKLAAIGVRARKWVTYHGLALNVSTVLQPFKLIIPCGIAGRPVGSVRTALSGCITAGAQVATAAAASAALTASSACSEQLNVVGNVGNNRSSSNNTGGCQHSSSGDDMPMQPSSSSQTGDKWQQQLYSVRNDTLIVEYRCALLEAFEDVFGLHLQPASQQQKEQLLQS